MSERPAQREIGTAVPNGDSEDAEDVAADRNSERSRCFIDGRCFGEPYEVAILNHPKANENVLEGHGAERVANLLEAHEGDIVRLTVTGPTVPIATSTPLGVYAGIINLTEVTDIRGRLPRGVPRADPGTVY